MENPSEHFPHFSSLCRQAFEICEETARERQESPTLMHLLVTLLDINSGDIACILSHYGISHQSISHAAYDLLEAETLPIHLTLSLAATMNRMMDASEHYAGRLVRSSTIIDVLYSLFDAKALIKDLQLIDLNELHDKFEAITFESIESYDGEGGVTLPKGTFAELLDSESDILLTYWKDRSEVRNLLDVVGSDPVEPVLLVTEVPEFSSALIGAFQKSLDRRSAPPSIRGKKVTTIEASDLLKEVAFAHDKKAHVERFLKTRDILIIPEIDHLFHRDDENARVCLDALNTKFLMRRLRMIATVSASHYEMLPYVFRENFYTIHLPLDETSLYTRLLAHLSVIAGREYDVSITADTVDLVYDFLKRQLPKERFIKEAKRLLNYAARRVKTDEISLAIDSRVTTSVMKKVIADTYGLNASSLYHTHEFPRMAFEQSFIEKVPGQNHLATPMANALQKSLLQWELMGEKVPPFILCGMVRGLEKEILAEISKMMAGSEDNCVVLDAMVCGDRLPESLLERIKAAPTTVVCVKDIEHNAQQALNLMKPLMYSQEIVDKHGAIIDCSRIQFVLTTGFGTEGIQQFLMRESQNAEMSQNHFMQGMKFEAMPDFPLADVVEYEGLVEATQLSLATLLPERLMQEAIIFPCVGLAPADIELILSQELKRLSDQLESRYGLTLQVESRVGHFLKRKTLAKEGSKLAAKRAISKHVFPIITPLIKPQGSDTMILRLSVTESGSWLQADLLSTDEFEEVIRATEAEY